MSQTHDLKIYPQHYARVANGQKTFEIRNNDRGFQTGDKVILREWDPKPINPTDDVPHGFTDAPPLEFKIGYVHLLGRDEVCFSLLPFPKKEETPDSTGPKTKKAKNT